VPAVTTDMKTHRDAPGHGKERGCGPKVTEVTNVFSAGRHLRLPHWEDQSPSAEVKAFRDGFVPPLNGIEFFNGIVL
jgi:hypothetical protein